MVDGEWCIVDSAGIIADSSWLIARPPAPFDRLRVTVEDDGEERFWLIVSIVYSGWQGKAHSSWLMAIIVDGEKQ